MSRQVGSVVLALSRALTVGLTSLAASSLASADEGNLSKVMGSITIAPGQHAGDVATVNGSIHIGANAVVGKANTVNGSLSVDSRATTGELTTVNGSVQAHDGVHVNGGIHTVNGSIHVDNTADVTSDITNVNGGIYVFAAHVGGSIDTVTGNIDIGPNAHIDGAVTMEQDHGWHFGFQSLPRVVVEPGSVIRGKLHFEREVVLYVSDRATIGPVEGAKVIKFSGDHPPS